LGAKYQSKAVKTEITTVAKLDIIKKVFFYEMYSSYSIKIKPKNIKMENYLFVPKICKPMKSSWAWIIRLKRKWILHL